MGQDGNVDWKEREVDGTRSNARHAVDASAEERTTGAHRSALAGRYGLGGWMLQWSEAAVGASSRTIAIVSAKVGIRLPDRSKALESFQLIRILDSIWMSGSMEGTGRLSDRRQSSGKANELPSSVVVKLMQFARNLGSGDALVPLDSRAVACQRNG